MVAGGEGTGGVGVGKVGGKGEEGVGGGEGGVMWWVGVWMMEVVEVVGMGNREVRGGLGVEVGVVEKVGEGGMGVGGKSYVVEMGGEDKGRG